MLTRRGFLAGSAAVLAARAQTPPPERPIRAAVFSEPGFPSVDIAPLGPEALDAALRGFELSWVGEAELQDLPRYDLLITPYGSAFPKAAWPHILEYLRRGGNWVNLGGVPFSVPVVRENGEWRQEVRQTAYHKALFITQAFAVSADRINSWQEGAVAAGSFHADAVYELYIRLTSTHEFADEIGSAGMREATMHALVYGLDRTGLRIAAPFVQIDRLEGPFAGGRWVLANLRGSLSPAAIRVLVTTASEGAREFEVRPSFACYYGDERPSFTVRLKGRRTEKQCEIEVRNEAGSVITKLTGVSGEALMPAGSPALPPGLYRVEARLGMLRCQTGFLVAREPGMGGGTPFTCNRDYLLRDGQPFVVTGTTYMAADAQRKFLLEPNPAVWDRDFAEMKRAGVNMVRTGIWTGWKQIMPEVGRVQEGCLRALDAFLAVARRHQIAVIFNLFAFLPETWGGRNPYLDPRSVRAQKEFVFQLAERCRGANDLTWDLINEPSFCSPAHVFSCRPNYDEYERSAWHTWLKARFADETKLREIWGLTPLDAIDLPALEDFSDQNIFDKTRPLPVLEYHLFAQDMFNQWVREISSAIRANGNKHQLITVGQDEGGLSNQPSPLFHDKVVDFTCVHNWWLNDDLLWDSVLTKSPAKPNLVEESGIMFYETMRRTPGRTEEEARNLLERKMAFAMGASGAGFIQWLWNTNAYIADDNEASIGFFRADGTAKPELEPFRAMAAFWREHGSLLVDKELEDVVMVVPHSHMFSVRDLASAATKRALRVMHYECLTPMRAAGEYALEREFTPARLILLPCPQVLTSAAWNVLLAAVRNGATLLVTGVIDRDEHWMPVERSRELGLRAAVAPVAQEEALRVDGVDERAGFHGDSFQRVEKAVVEGEESAEVRTIPLGAGKVIWCPLPLETAAESAPVAALYRYALKQAQVRPVFSAERADPSVLIRPSVLAQCVLYTMISESGQHQQIRLTHAENGARISVSLPPQRAAHVLLDRRDGRVIGQLLPA
ncbi:MAG: cellulase family glycosylhydrolase [Bryobacteraceae bacterium]|jgi:hypothetical protein